MDGKLQGICVYGRKNLRGLDSCKKFYFLDTVEAQFWLDKHYFEEPA